MLRLNVITFLPFGAFRKGDILIPKQGIVQRSQWQNWYLPDFRLWQCLCCCFEAGRLQDTNTGKYCIKGQM
jgi:hypothetical protein